MHHHPSSFCYKISNTKGGGREKRKKEKKIDGERNGNIEKSNHGTAKKKNFIQIT